MARTLFFRMVIRKFSEITKNKPSFGQYNIFYNYEYFFFQSAFDLFSIIAKKVDQIRNNVVCVAARLVFLICCALLRAVAVLFHIISWIKRNRSFTACISRLYYFLWLCLHAWLLMLNGVALNKLDKNNDPIRNTFLTNPSILLYVALQLVFFRHVRTILFYFSSSNTYEYL